MFTTATDRRPPGNSNTMRESRKSPASNPEQPIGAANSTADRAIDILLLFTDDHPVWSAADIAAHFGMPRSTTYRYLNSLRSYALIVEDETVGFRLGPRVFPLARVAKSHMSVIRIAQPELVKLAATFGELVVLHQRVGYDIVALDRIESPHRVSLSSTRSHLLPWPATSSAKVLLAFAPQAERDELLRMLHPVKYTPHTLTTKAALKSDLDRIRSQGYGTTEEERDEGVWGAAAPVFERGEARYCLAVAAPRFRLTRDKMADMVRDVRVAAENITAMIAAVEF